MNFFVTLVSAAVFGCSLIYAADVTPLPGEDGVKAALGCEPFPSRMHAFIWRNWSVVPVVKLAEVLQTTPDKVTHVAASMGLAPQGRILAEWKSEGYITVLRRNWHLLPYEQLLMLLDFSREKLREHLIENDFLYIKLGSVKPKCEPLRYHEPSAAEGSRAGELAAWLQEEGVAEPLLKECEPRFSFISELSVPLESKSVPRKAEESIFDLRLIFSYFADYADPLYETEVSSYPEGLLQRLAANGVNAVWVHTVLRTLAPPTQDFPEFGKDHEKRIAGLKVLVKRARKYGIDVYLYLNEPRAMPADFFALSGAQNLKGVEKNGLGTMCTSAPAVRKWMADSLTFVFREVEGLGGVFTITASENLTSCASHRLQQKCERCGARSYADVIAEVNTTIADGVRGGNAKAKTIVWDWGWDDAHAPEIIAKLPKACWFMSVSEWSLPIERGGIKSTVGEYSLSAPGPGPRASKHWALARAAGLKTMAKVQAGSTWELCVIPYLPVMDLVAEHARKLSGANVDGVMLSWSLGCYPSPNMQVFQRIRGGSQSVDDVLNDLAQSFYGEKGMALARQAWQTFSDGFKEYPYHISTLYNGPQHMGPANPLFLNATGYHSTMVGFPYDDLKGWISIYPPEVWISQMEKVRQAFEKGCALYAQLGQAVDSAQRDMVLRELNTYRAATLHFESCVNQARFVNARNQLDKQDVDREQSLQIMREAARAELNVARRMLPLVYADARIGYESSNHYFYVPQDLKEKIMSCRYVLSQLN